MKTLGWSKSKSCRQYSQKFVEILTSKFHFVIAKIIQTCFSCWKFWSINFEQITRIINDIAAATSYVRSVYRLDVVCWIPSVLKKNCHGISFLRMKSIFIICGINYVRNKMTVTHYRWDGGHYLTASTNGTAYPFLRTNNDFITTWELIWWARRDKQPLVVCCNRSRGWLRGAPFTDMV